MYKYFVSFCYENGFGNTILNYETLVNSIDTLREAEEYIRVLKSFKSVSISLKVPLKSLLKRWKTVVSPPLPNANPSNSSS